MEPSRHRPWLPAMLYAGVAYCLIGRVFAAPTSNVQFWRLAAWATSGIVYAVHIGYEHYRLRNPPVRGAMHVAAAAAIGAFLLALAAGLRSLVTTSTVRPLWLVAIVAWPAITALPAFLVALVVWVVLARLPRSADVR